MEDRDHLRGPIGMLRAIGNAKGAKKELGPVGAGLKPALLALAYLVGEIGARTFLSAYAAG